MHFEAGVECGDRIGHIPAIEQLVRKGSELVAGEMVDELQIEFDRSQDGELDRCSEGAHSVSRILHVGDGTGKAIHNAYLQAAQSNPNITILANRTAVDLLTTHHHGMKERFRYDLENRCVGAYVLNNTSGDIDRIVADATILARVGEAWGWKRKISWMRNS